MQSFDTPNLISVNLHITPACNYECKFCFAHFSNANTLLRFDEWSQIIQLLHDHGTQKVTFVGGEPLLHPDLSKLLKFSHSLGLTTTIVTNGSLITKKFLLVNHEFIDWIGFSIDTSSDAIERSLGRTTKVKNPSHNHINHILSLLPDLTTYGINIKVNSVITSLNYTDNMHELIRKINPKRWKVFQILPIEGENDKYSSKLEITTDQFNFFINYHQALHPIAESNDAMTGSYVMINPSGRFFDNTTGRLLQSRPILKDGLVPAFQDISFSFSKLLSRGGLYGWDNNSSEAGIIPYSEVKTID